MSLIKYLNLMHLCRAVSGILDQEMRDIFYKTAVSGQTKVSSDVKNLTIRIFFLPKFKYGDFLSKNYQYIQKIGDYYKMTVIEQLEVFSDIMSTGQFLIF